MRKRLFTGLAVLLPAAITIIIVRYILSILTAPFYSRLTTFIESYQFLSIHPHFLSFFIQIIALLFLLGITFILGILANRLLFSWAIDKMHALILKIPFINVIFKIVKELTQLTFTHPSRLFKKVVLSPFCSQNARVTALLSSNAPKVIQKALNARSKKTKYKTLFISTCPHPISGMLIVMDQKNIQNLEMNIEEMFKFLISIGTYHPEPKNDEDSQ